MTGSEKPIGLTKDAGYQIGVRRTIHVSHSRAWDMIFSTEGMNIWLGPTSGIELEPGQTYELGDGASGEVRVVKPGSHIRLTWQPPEYSRPSIIQVRVLDKGGKSVIAFHQEHLPDGQAREARRAHFANALDRIEEQVAT